MKIAHRLRPRLDCAEQIKIWVAIDRVEHTVDPRPEQHLL